MSNLNSDRGHSPSKFPRSPSRSSLRTHSPSFSLDDPGKPSSSLRPVSLLTCRLVAVRNQVSTLKHTIRHQQAQLHNLENVLRGPRKLQELPQDDMASPPPSSYVPVDATPTKVKRRSSYDILQGIAGPDSSLPLPKKDGLEENGIQEGVPANFGTSPASPIPSYKRVSSPTRTLSRMSFISTRATIFYMTLPAVLQVSPLHL